MRLETELVTPRPYRRLVWKRDTAGVLRCGPLSIEWRLDTERSQWFVCLDGVVIEGRGYGYSDEWAALRAAPHLGKVREMMADAKP